MNRVCAAVLGGSKTTCSVAPKFELEAGNPAFFLLRSMKNSASARENTDLPASISNFHVTIHGTYVSENYVSEI